MMLSQVTVNIHHVRSFYFVSESLYSTVEILMTATARVLFLFGHSTKNYLWKKNVHV